MKVSQGTKIFSFLSKAVRLIPAALLLLGCSRVANAPTQIKLVLVDQSWLSKEFEDWHAQAFQQFEHETGVKVELAPAPESAADQLSLWKKFLETGSSTPDVYAIDVIWPRILAEYLVDLKPYLSEPERDVYLPNLLANDTVNGRLVAIPSRADSGLLYYRSDLLRRYGYQHPPETWDELEKMAAKIQEGERSRGNKDFWGYVWQGSAAEGLTCDALEWQAAEGGGKVVEDNNTVSVNNPHAIRAWKRAAKWVGTISPPGIVAYREWDSMNVWQSGNAAFMRNWTAAYARSKAANSKVRDKFDIALLPKGQAGHTATLGGLGYGVSRFSRHPKEAIALALFLSRRDTQAAQARMLGEPSTISALYDDRKLIEEIPYWGLFTPYYMEGLITRPAQATGDKYMQVSKAYFDTVHSVLSGKKDAAVAAAELEKQLMQMTGFPRGAPLPFKGNRSD